MLLNGNQRDGKNVARGAMGRKGKLKTDRHLAPTNEEHDDFYMDSHNTSSIDADSLRSSRFADEVQKITKLK